MDLEKYEIEYRYMAGVSGQIRVSVNLSRSYAKTIPVALELQDALRHKIPFSFEKLEDAQIRILGGDRRSGMLSIEMTIRSLAPMDKAIEMLKSNGFIGFFEQTK